jgi:uncharacterized membrane protein YbhN (UPF0104 family)
VDSLRSFWDALGRFVDAIGSVGLTALALALGLHLLNLLLRTRAWRNILRAAYPGVRVRWSTTFAAYCAGVGLNGVAPARGGDVLKLFLVHRKTPETTYPTLASSLVAETLFDAFVGLGLLIWAWQLGVFPDLPSLPDLPAFEWSWLADHPWGTAVALGAVLLALIVGFLWVQRRVRGLWGRLKQGLAILTTPKRYLARVVSLQAMGWGCRLGSAYFFLEAFHIPASARNAAVVLVVQGVATAIPLTPGGLGPKQALLVVLLGGQAAHGDLLAFSVGMELAVLIFNLVLGAACLAATLGGFNFKRALAEARAKRPQTGG